MSRRGARRGWRSSPCTRFSFGPHRSALAALEAVTAVSVLCRLADVLDLAAGRTAQRGVLGLAGSELVDSVKSGGADAVGASPVTRPGWVGVVAGDGGMAELAAA